MNKIYFQELSEEYNYKLEVIRRIIDFDNIATFRHYLKVAVYTNNPYALDYLRRFYYLEIDKELTLDLLKEYIDTFYNMHQHTLKFAVIELSLAFKEFKYAIGKIIGRLWKKN